MANKIKYQNRLKMKDAEKEKFGYEMITRAGKMKVGKLLKTDKE